MSDVTPNQSYLAKWMQYKIAAALAALMQDQGANITTKTRDGKAWEKPADILWWPSSWRKDDQKFKMRLHESVSGYHACLIRFSNARWDSQLSDLRYGEKSIDKKVNERQDNKTKIVHNDTDSKVHVAYEESVELTNSFSSSITKGVTLDLTKEAGVDTSLTVKGGYAGVEAEATVAAHFGISQSKSESTEQGKEESEEGTKSESLAIDFDAEPRSYYLVEVKKENEETSQPFEIDGVMDFDIHLDYYRIEHSHSGKGFEHKSTLSFKGIDGLLQYVHGYDTNHSEMEGYWNRAPQHVKDAISFIESADSRRIQVKGVSHASLDSNADYDVELLGDHVPDGLEDLPVVDAVDA